MTAAESTAASVTLPPPTLSAEYDSGATMERPNNASLIPRGPFVKKLSDDVIEAVADAIRSGASIDTAARFSGLHRATYHRWMQEGRDAMRGDGPVPEALAMQVKFVEAMEVALAEFKVKLTGEIYAHGKENWTALAWLLERRFPDEFGRRARLEHANADGQPFRITPTPVFDPDKLSDEELATMIELVEKARPDERRPLPVIEGTVRAIEG